MDGQHVADSIPHLRQNFSNTSKPMSSTNINRPSENFAKKDGTKYAGNTTERWQNHRIDPPENYDSGEICKTKRVKKAQDGDSRILSQKEIGSDSALTAEIIPIIDRCDM
ncbi:hypothetical protein HUJ04_011641 [Dendroctonus ponderosae]|nr:hypothetical protein HUJ04_011641 [Dendroctonus ponderosae]